MYKIALEKYNLLKSNFTSNFDLFTLDINILYNGNADLIGELYRQLKKIDSSNIIYYQSLKEHLLNELDYVMYEGRWEEADYKNWQFLLVSSGKEKEQYLGLNDIKNFNCNDLKKLDSLWTKNSQGHFGYSVQERIYLTTGNSLEFDWDKGNFTKWNQIIYNRFAEEVGWKKEDGEWLKYHEIPWKWEIDFQTERYGILPRYGSLLGVVSLDNCCASGPALLLQKLVDCSG
jgi:hypothetical protein